MPRESSHCLAPRTASAIQRTAARVRSGPVDLVLDQLPNRLWVGARRFGLQYRTVNLEHESFEKLVVIVSEGIDWQRVRERAQELGMKADSEHDLLAALWAAGLSTSLDVSDISGRGVGLSSVLKVCESLGIRTRVESIQDSGTTFRFTLPERAAGESARELRVSATAS